MKLTRKSFAYPYLVFMVVLVGFPLLILLFYSFTQEVDGTLVITLENFKGFFVKSYYLSVFWDSIKIGVFTTLLCLLIAYPLCMVLVNKKYNRSTTLVMAFIIPMWINFLLRTVATKELFYFFEVELGMTAVMFGMVYNFLPYMILPIYNTLSKMDHSLIEAARDLGATPSQVFFKTTLPLSLPGVMSGITMVFVPSISTYVITDMLSNKKISLFGNLIYNRVYDGSNIGVGGALSIIMFVVILLSMAFTRKYEEIGGDFGGVSI